MERMKHTGDYELDTINMLEQECSDLEEENKQLEKENKNLKLIQETNEKQIQNDIRERDELREENKNLKEKIQTLELWLDNKEKLNEEYRKQIDKLKSDLGECECSFGFENDEVGYRKRECKKLKEENEILEEYKLMYEGLCN